MEFCKAFNAQTQKMEPSMPIPVVITAFSDRYFTFKMKTPPATYFLKKAANITSGSKTPGRPGSVAGSVTLKQCRDIAEAKFEALNASDLDQATNIIAG